MAGIPSGGYLEQNSSGYSSWQPVIHVSANAMLTMLGPAVLPGSPAVISPEIIPGKIMFRIVLHTQVYMPGVVLLIIIVKVALL